MTMLACAYMLWLITATIPDVVLKSPTFLPFVMEQSKHAAPTAHTEFIGKSFSKCGHSLQMLFIALDVPAIFAVFINMGYCFHYLVCLGLTFVGLRYSSWFVGTFI